jgi:Glycosyltransferase family 87
VVCLPARQLSIFLLTGVVLFLYFHRTRPTLAGAALLPCALKPHLFLVFALGLLLWMVHRRAWRVLAGFVAALLLSCAVTWWFDPHAWQQYFAMMGETRVMQVFIPTFGMTLRYLVDRNLTALAFVPLVLGCLWTVWYFGSRRDYWNWMQQGLVLLVVSDVCAPYGYFTDECILLPFVLAGLYAAVDAKRSFLPLVILDAAAIIEAYAQVNIISPWYLWSVPAWVGWYLYATRKPGAPAGQPGNHAATGNAATGSG